MRVGMGSGYPPWVSGTDIPIGQRNSFGQSDALTLCGGHPTGLIEAGHFPRGRSPWTWFAAKSCRARSRLSSRFWEHNISSLGNRSGLGDHCLKLRKHLNAGRACLLPEEGIG